MPSRTVAEAGLGVATPDIAAVSRRVRAELVGNVLPFWANVAVDHERGGVHARVSDDLTVDDTGERSAVVCARVLWAFAAAARVLGEPSFLAIADLAYDYLTRHFVDRKHGGVFWSVDGDGTVVNDRKQIYAQAFAVYGLAEYARATGAQAPLALAAELVGLIEAHGSDPVHGGYIEARARDWSPIDDQRLSPKDLNAPKSMNTLLHVMEAYTTYVQATGDEKLRQRLADLVAVILDHVVNPEAGCFTLFFAQDWTPLAATVSYGHDIEGAWLLVAAASVVDDPALQARAEQAAVAMAEAVLRHGRTADGAVAYEFEPARGPHPAHTDTDSHWWAQAEGAVGFLDAHRLTGDARFEAAGLACWDFIEAHHVDRVNGDWFKVLDENRVPRPEYPKVGAWECPYHHVRACLELIQRLDPTNPRPEEGAQTR